MIPIEALLWLTAPLLGYLAAITWYRSLRGEPPGPVFQIPIIGETLTMLSRGVPAWNCSMVTTYGSTYQASVLGHKTFCICDPTHIQALLLQENKLVGEDWPAATHVLIGRYGLPLLSGAEHQSFRKLLEPAFKLSALQGTFPNIVAIARERCAAWAARGSIDAFLKFREIPLQVVLMIMGYAAADITDQLLESFARDSQLFSKGLFSPPVNLPGFDYYKSLRARPRMVTKLLKHIGDLRAKAEAGHALEGIGEKMVVMRTEDGQALSDEAILDNFLVFIFAGQDTTANVMMHAMVQLANHPRVLAKLRAEQDEAMQRHGKEITPAVVEDMPYADAVLKEVMRCSPPIGCQFRRALQDFELGGFKVQKGQKLILGLGCAYRADPRWADAGGDLSLDSFYPERWQTEEGRRVGAHIPFAIGARMCIAWRLATMELKVFLAIMLRDYQWRLLDTRLEWDYFPFIQPKDKLMVELQPRLNQGQASA